MLKPTTRFCPTPNGPIHLGHAWCAWLNYCYGDPKGIILRIEDVTAATATGVPLVTAQAAVSDFQKNLGRLRIPVKRTVFQSDRLKAYEKSAQFLGGWAGKWATPTWCSNWIAPGLPDGAASSSSYMAHVSRVVDDFEFGISDVIRGEDLFYDAWIYFVIYDMMFPARDRLLRPRFWFIPLVCEGGKTCPTCAKETKQPVKISKSKIRGGGYFLSDFEFDPFILLRNLADRMMMPTTLSGPVAGISDLDSLRAWTQRAALNPSPKFLEKGEHLGWH